MSLFHNLKILLVFPLFLYLLISSDALHKMLPSVPVRCSNLFLPSCTMVIIILVIMRNDLLKFRQIFAQSRSRISLPFSELVVATCSSIRSFKFLLRHICWSTFSMETMCFVQISCNSIIVFIQNIGNTAAHTCCKVLSCFSKHNHTTAGHVFTSMITYTFYNSSMHRSYGLQKRSPATPLINALPLVAPYSATLPMMILSSALNCASSWGGYTISLPPESPFPK